MSISILKALRSFLLKHFFCSFVFFFFLTVISYETIFFPLPPEQIYTPNCLGPKPSIEAMEQGWLLIWEWRTVESPQVLGRR